jgi:hypothetical protein
MITMAEKAEYLWSEFEEWAEQEGTGEDWKPWWGCWKRAIETQRQFVGNKVILPRKPAPPWNDLVSNIGTVKKVKE